LAYFATYETKNIKSGKNVLIQKRQEKNFPQENKN
jgi:hypothetical protein